MEEISRILFLVVIINSLSIVARAKLTISIDFKSQTIATFFSSILAIWLAFNGYGYWALVWLMLSKALLNTIVLWFFCRWFPSFIFSKDSLKSLFKFGSNLMIAGFVATFVNNLYVALVGRYFKCWVFYSVCKSYKCSIWCDKLHFARGDISYHDIFKRRQREISKYI